MLSCFQRSKPYALINPAGRNDGKSVTLWSLYAEPTGLAYRGQVSNSHGLLTQKPEIESAEVPVRIPSHRQGGKGTVQWPWHARVQQVLGIVFSLGARLVDQVAAATYSAEQRSHGSLRRSIGRFLKFTLSGTLVALVGVCLVVLITSRGAPSVDAGVIRLWWWALPLCFIRPVFWNFNLSFKATSRPRLLLLSVLADTAFLLVFALILIPLLGARGLFLALIVSSASTVALQWLWSVEFRGPQLPIPAVLPEQKGT